MKKFFLRTSNLNLKIGEIILEHGEPVLKVKGKGNNFDSVPFSRIKDEMQKVKRSA